MNDLFNGAVEMLKNVTDVLKSWALNWQRLFLSETPEEVPIKQLDIDGNVVDNTTVKNLAMIKAEFEEWKETVLPQIGYRAVLGDKINNGIINPTIDGIGWDQVDSKQHPAGYLISKPYIYVPRGSTVFAEITLAADVGVTTGAITEGILELRRESNGSLYSSFTLKASRVASHLLNPTIPWYIAVKDGYGSNGVNVAPVWVLTGDNSADVTDNDIPAVTNFYGRIRLLNIVNTILLPESNLLIDAIGWSVNPREE